MAKNKDKGGVSKRQELCEKHRHEEQRNRWIWIGLIIVGVFLVAFFLIYPQLKPIASIQAATPRSRPTVSANSTGDPNAPVKLTEFSDFQCPYCKNFWQETEAQVIDAYVKTGKVLYTYRTAGNFVSSNINKRTGGNDTESQNSAMTAYCAGDQNKFWEMHDALFTNILGEADGISFTDRRLQAIAQNIGLDMTSFNSCYSSNKYKNQVDQDLNDAVSSNFRGTPYFVISYTVNGQMKTVPLDGAQPFSVFQQEIDKALTVLGK